MHCMEIDVESFSTTQVLHKGIVVRSQESPSLCPPCLRNQYIHRLGCFVRTGRASCTPMGLSFTPEIVVVIVLVFQPASSLDIRR